MDLFKDPADSLDLEKFSVVLVRISVDCLLTYLIDRSRDEFNHVVDLLNPEVNIAVSVGLPAKSIAAVA